LNGAFKFLLGVNYWPRRLNIRMWRDWNEDFIREDAAKMRELGVRAVRAFIKCEDFADDYGNVKPEALEKLRRFLDILWEHGVQAFVTFLVGHMSGKNWRIPWTDFDKIYTPEVVARTARFVEQVVSALKGHPAVAGWILSNELSLVKRASSREEALVLLKSFTEAVKKNDGRHVVSSGDVPDSYMQETPNVKDIVDYVGPHLYLYDDDEVRHGYTYGALIELFSCGGLAPVILEEFGFSTHQFSEQSQAEFINEVLYTALAHEASGAFVWCFSDFPDESDPPYEWRPLELGFGIIRRDGTPKPAAAVFRRFSENLGKLESIGFNTKFRRVVHAAVVAPFYMFRDYEFIWYRNALGFWGIARILTAALTLFTATGVPASVVYELEWERFKAYKLIAMPSTVVALSSTWRHALNYVQSGGVLYASFVRGFGWFKAGHEASTHLWSELYGIENTLRAGAYGRRYTGRVQVEFVKDFGPIRRGERIEVNFPEPVYAYTARPVDSEAIAIDGDGEPVIFAAKRGEGLAVASMIPFELTFTAEKFDWNSNIFKFYRALGEAASSTPPYTSTNPVVEVQTFTGGELDLLIVVNHGSETAVKIVSSLKIRRAELMGGNSTLASVEENHLELNMPRKGSATILIYR